jgi:hypothetical protein
MTENLSELSRSITGEIGKQAGRFGRASLFVKVVFIAIFSAVAGIAQFVQFPPTGPEPWQIVGIFASMIVAIGGVFVLITEQDATKQLSLAHKALEAARDAEARYEIIDDLESDIVRLIELFQSMSVMRSAIERLASAGISDENDIAAKILKASERSLAIAMDFAQSDQWTIGIYRAVPCTAEENRAWLECIAHKRAIECNPSEARRWKEGTGIMGVSYANGDEIIVPDLQADGMSAVFGTSANEPRAYDNERYRSMVAVPIKVHGMSKPWGVVTATNDRVGHFTPNDDTGVRPDEGARALAGMVALAIAVMRKNGSVGTNGG